MVPSSQHPTRLVGSVERAVAVLETLAASDRDLGTNEIARRTGINPSTVSRLLATLGARGLVSHVTETGRYRPGLGLLQLGNAALARLDLRSAARPYLARLVAATGETATLSVPDEREAVTVDFVQGESSVQSIARVGRPSVAHATAVGKVLLAHGGELPRGKLCRYTERTIIDRSRLAAEAERARRRGWAEAIGERESDLNAIAAPVTGARSELLAVLGIQGPAGRLKAATIRTAVPVLLSCARSLSADLSGTPSPTVEPSGSSEGATG
ncbi:MAG: IclR family transcriptional regulator [Actinomycetota bacterium]